ncbi:ABC transporter substrate-binding protein (plasmid) [Sinorhizobium meliloti WSM1022]|jgi:putative spermidine/putrescine transport system substrate-binding protein|uniref:Extracellular solute-binding protein n=1 Tax=Rhizobium meliloti TaxID=382 RepID=A0A6A7ZQ58_RHIML|nr:ABC transporter substrate-binding protein [Sinorhizobium meliloti]ASJ61976.1 spermidine/putrescine ABC transporter substrate-binding protein [Sinorhizobium meliloti]ASQ06947.1 spermidine/putrescine ABC transporter substrate-binding protein [Sinorhizobium meliloti]ASQ12185.1 spermidine/putrescine ABC transporter substrate-binding protein [Sinorhizobium meliloti]MCK3784962.1 ABC transporter substrate-binding protein [Sinorhizobium meliloti]MCK3791087.1 ABC transporter substrate-binding protei
MKTIFKSGVLVAAVAVLSASLAAPAFARDLTVVSWGGNYQDAQRDIYFKPFAEKSGKPVLDETWDGGIGVIQSKVKAGAPNWDAVQVEAEELALGCADGLYETIDWDKMGGKGKFLESAVNDCGVGAIVWSTAIAYDGDKLKEGPVSWADFWNVEKFPGKRSLRKGPKYTLEFALLADGVSKDELYDVLATDEGVERAFKKLGELKPHIVWWESGAQPLQFLASGEVAMTSAYNGRITGINRTEGKNFKVVWPGSIYAVDSWVVLKDAENKDAAQDFIAFASLPEHQAKLPEFVAYGLPNKEAAARVPPEFAKDLPTDPVNMKEAISLNVDFWIDNAETLTQRFNAWLAQ